MRINQGLELREMCGEYIVIGTGVENIDFSKVVNLNESAAYLWNEVRNKEFTPEMLAALLLEQYDVDEALAMADATELVALWVREGLVAE
ncbi:MAG: PqqD family protein [Bacteroidaceae bacterium]|nr:PqqD family protein [Bacteroidaceae bacterium]